MRKKGSTEAQAQKACFTRLNDEILMNVCLNAHLGEYSCKWLVKSYIHVNIWEKLDQNIGSALVLKVTVA